MRQELPTTPLPEHLALAYDAWAPIKKDGKVPDTDRASWLSNLANIPVSPDYSRFFESWKKSFNPNDHVFELELTSRLLIGHGNSSATDVGITVHHTWGVPVIPGSAIKGLVAHFVDAVYGPDDPDRNPWEQEGEERTRVAYQGVTWHGRRIERGPGAVYRALFGAPDAHEDNVMREQGFEAGAAAGLVTFHDALYVPEETNNPFVADVLTVHQKNYYSLHENWPNDYDSPNPVAFLTVRPKTRFLFALSGPPGWGELAQYLLCEALKEWGIGGKTSAGYGRMIPPERLAASKHNSFDALALPKAGEHVEVTLLEERTKKGGWKAKHEGSGLIGPIMNTSNVPATAKVGDRLTLIVAHVNSHDIAFRVPTAGDSKAEKKGKT